MNQQTSEKQDALPTKQEDKNIEKHTRRLAKALEHVYGNPWSIIWRNFLAGLTHAIGATIGYVLFLGIAILIAQRLGVFNAINNMWEKFLDRLPFEQGQNINTKGF